MLLRCYIGVVNCNDILLISLVLEKFIKELDNVVISNVEIYNREIYCFICLVIKCKNWFNVI